MGRALLPHTTPGGEHSHIHRAFPSGLIGAYRGIYIVDGSESDIQLLRRSLWDESLAPLEVSLGGSEGRGGGGRGSGGKGNRGRDGNRGGGGGGDRDNRDSGDDRDKYDRDSTTGVVSLVEGGGTGTGILPGGAVGGGGHVAGGGTDPQGGMGLQHHWPSEDCVEGSYVDYRYPIRRPHCLPHCPPWFLGRLRHRYRLP